jgi:hypothetical protein
MDKKVKEKIVCFFPRSQSSFDDLWLRSFFTALSLSLSPLDTLARAPAFPRSISIGHRLCPATAFAISPPQGETQSRRRRKKTFFLKHQSMKP